MLSEQILLMVAKPTSLDVFRWQYSTICNICIKHILYIFAVFFFIWCVCSAPIHSNKLILFDLLLWQNEHATFPRKIFCFGYVVVFVVIAYEQKSVLAQCFFCLFVSHPPTQSSSILVPISTITSQFIHHCLFHIFQLYGLLFLYLISRK